MTSSIGNIFRVTGLSCGEFTGEFPTQRPVSWSFDVFIDLRLYKRMSKQWWGWWFETPSCPVWRHCNWTMATMVGVCSNHCDHCLRRMTTMVGVFNKHCGHCLRRMATMVGVFNKHRSLLPRMTSIVGVSNNPLWLLFTKDQNNGWCIQPLWSLLQRMTTMVRVSSKPL